MNRVKYLLSLVVFGCGLGLIYPGGAHGTPFTNGSFELGTNTGSSHITLGTGSTAVTGWTVTAPIDYISGLWQASDGSRSLDLNAFAAGGIQQMFDTIPDTQYEVKFDLAGNAAGGPTIKQMRIQVDSVSLWMKCSTSRGKV